MISTYSFLKLCAALITFCFFCFFMSSQKIKGEQSRVTSVLWFALVISAAALSCILTYSIVYYHDLAHFWVSVVCGALVLAVGSAAFYLCRLRDIKKRKIAGALMASLCLLVFLSFFHSRYLGYQSIIAKPCPEGQVLNVSDKGKMFKHALIGGPVNHVPFIRCVTP